MKNIFDYIVYASTVLGAIGVIIIALKRCLSSLFEPICKKLNFMDRRECRHFLVSFLCDIENGIEKDEVQWQLAHETYDYYRDTLKENSYVHDKWERVVDNASDRY